MGPVPLMLPEKWKYLLESAALLRTCIYYKNVTQVSVKCRCTVQLNDKFTLYKLMLLN